MHDAFFFCGQRFSTTVEYSQLNRTFHLRSCELKNFTYLRNFLSTNPCHLRSRVCAPAHYRDAPRGCRFDNGGISPRGDNPPAKPALPVSDEPGVDQGSSFRLPPSQASAPPARDDPAHLTGDISSALNPDREAPAGIPVEDHWVGRWHEVGRGPSSSMGLGMWPLGTYGTNFVWHGDVPSRGKG